MNTEIFFDCKIFFNKVISRIRQKLLETGANTIATIPKFYRTVESFDGKNNVGVYDFLAGLQSFGINLRNEEANVKFY
jgi:hypothetical protein